MSWSIWTVLLVAGAAFWTLATIRGAYKARALKRQVWGLERQIWDLRKKLGEIPETKPWPGPKFALNSGRQA